jgi:hypothetical protein
LYQIALEEDIEYPSKYKVGVKYINPAKDILSLSKNIKYLQLKNLTLELLDTFKGEKVYSIHDWVRLDMLLRLR